MDSNPRQIPPRTGLTNRQPVRGGRFFDVLTALFLLATVLVISLTLLLLSNPQSSLNPWRASETPTLLALLSPTASREPSITPTATQTATATATTTPIPSLTPTETPLPSLTPTDVIPGASDLTEEIFPTPTLSSAFPFFAREVRYEQNTNSQGCQWLSIAGNVTGVSGEPLSDLVVEIIGEDFEAIAISGSVERFGLSGFEYPIGETAEEITFSVRLMDPGGVPISDFVQVTTGDTCLTNVAIVEFVQLRPYN